MQRTLIEVGSAAAGAGKTKSPPDRGAEQWRVLRSLAPYVWPSDRPDLQATVIVSLLLMLLAKIVTVSMPFAFKWATDALVVQVREGMFAKVALHAVRKLALNTFQHMHQLSLRFHLERKTGGLTRVLERGRAGIENITRMTLMTFV